MEVVPSTPVAFSSTYPCKRRLPGREILNESPAFKEKNCCSKACGSSKRSETPLKSNGFSSRFCLTGNCADAVKVKSVKSTAIIRKRCFTDSFYWQFHRVGTTLQSYAIFMDSQLKT